MSSAASIGLNIHPFLARSGTPIQPPFVTGPSASLSCDILSVKNSRVSTVEKENREVMKGGGRNRKAETNALCVFPVIFPD